MENDTSELTESTPEVDQREPWQKNPKFNITTVILISFGFFASSAVWSVYDVQMPVTYGILLPGQYFLIGLLVTMNSIAGFFIQPFTGNLSDRTHSRFGRRMPFLIIGIPLSVVFLVILPVTFGSLVTVIPVVIIFVCMMAIWRAPVVGLMPDFVQPADRSKGNAIVNILGGIGTAVVSLVGGIIIGKGSTENLFFGFLFVGICMLAALAIVFFGVHEPDTRKWNFQEVATKKNEQGIIPKLREMAHEEEKSPLWMVVAIFFWFMTYYTFTDLFSLYATDPNILGLTRGTAQVLFFFVSVSFIIFALPASIIAKKITRKKTILIGLLISIAMLFLGSFVNSTSVTLMYVVLIGFGMGWAFINVNSIAMLWDMARTPKQIGTYTGIYYFGSFLAAILGPITVGYIMQYITGLPDLFPVGGCFMVVAFFVMFKVKRGEPELTPEELELKQKAIQQGTATPQTAARNGGKELDPARLEKLKDLVKVSKSLKVAQMAKILGLTEAEIYDHIVEWANQFGFELDQDVITFGAGQKDEFITQLDEEFKNWGTRTGTKDGKIEDGDP